MPDGPRILTPADRQAIRERWDDGDLASEPWVPIRGADVLALLDTCDAMQASIVEYVDAEREMHLLDREYDECVETEYDLASQVACLDRAIAARQRCADARAVLDAIREPGDG